MKKGLLWVLLFGLMAPGIILANGEGESATEGNSETEIRTMIAYWASGNDHEKKPDLGKIMSAMEEEVGFNFEYHIIPRDTYGDKMNLLFASGESIDMFSLEKSGAKVNDWAARGAIQPLSDLLEEEGQNILEYVGDGFYDCMDSQGVIWALPKFVSNARGWVPTIRTDWYKAFSGDDSLPSTIEELEAFFEYVKQNDLNNNGNSEDEIPFLPQDMGPITQWDGIFTDVVGNNKYLDENGVVQPREVHPQYITLLRTFRDWYAKGYIYKEFFVIKKPQMEDLITNNRIGMLSTWYSRYVRPIRPLMETVPEADFTLLPTIESPNAGITAAWSGGNPWQPITGIPSTSENPDLPIKFYNWYYGSKDNMQLAKRGFEGIHWEWENKEQGLFKTMEGANDLYESNGMAFTPSTRLDVIYTAVVDAKLDPINYEYAMCDKEMFADYMNYGEKFDKGVSYDLIGTIAEGVSADGDTLINEAKTKYILGSIDEDAWFDALDQYMDIAGDALSQVWTEQYNSYK